MPDQTILPGGEFTSTTEYDLDGAVGTLQFRVVNKATGDIAIDWAPSAIVQVSAAGEGPPWLYKATRAGVSTLGTYRLQWRDEPGNPARVWADTNDLIVVAAPPVDPAPNYFTLDELRARDTTLADAARYPDEKLEEVRALVQSRIERVCNVAFVPRTRTVTISGTGDQSIDVPNIFPREVTAATNADRDNEQLDITSVRVVDGIAFWRPEGWPRGTANLTLTYTHGHDAPPLPVKDAALIFSKVLLLQGPVTDRATQVAAGDGVSVLNLATPGLLGSKVGISAVDEILKEYREHVIA